MSEKSEIDTANNGGEDEDADQPISYFWWMLLAFLATGVALGQLGKYLFLTLDLPRDLRIVTVPWLILLLAAIHARPETFRQLGTAVAVGVAVAGLAMLCQLPIELFSHSLDDLFLGLTVDLLSMVLVLLLGLWIVLQAFRRLGVPRWESPAKDRT